MLRPVYLALLVVGFMGCGDTNSSSQIPPGVDAAPDTSRAHSDVHVGTDDSELGIDSSSPGTDASPDSMSTDDGGSLPVEDVSPDVPSTDDTGSPIPDVGEGDTSEPTCTPTCAGRSCGEDGCGGSCGSCDAGASCTNAGHCLTTTATLCAPTGLTGVGCCDGGELSYCNQDGKQVLVDCGGPCGWDPNNAYYECGFYGAEPSGSYAYQCVEPCVPDCNGKSCDGDGCGGSCGACGSGEACSAGACECAPQCSGKVCGTDGCGGTCGTCASNEACNAGACECVPECSGKSCGPDGCGQSCGSCDTDEACQGGACVCVPQCGGQECGDDGCGGSCGGCGTSQVCDAAGSCQATCDAGDLGPTPVSHEVSEAQDQDLGLNLCMDGELDVWTFETLHSFTPATSGNYKFAVTANASGAGVSVHEGCPSITHCVAHGDNPYGSSAEVVLWLDSGTEYSVLVSTTKNTGYTLAIDVHSSTGCEPQCDGASCGSDGCGGTCGSCDTSQLCVEGACEQFLAGATNCQDAPVIDSVPASVWTHRRTDTAQLEPRSVSCNNGAYVTTYGFGNGPAQYNQVWRFQVPSSAHYVIDDGSNGYAYLTTGCGGSAACLLPVKADQPIFLAAGKEYMLIADVTYGEMQNLTIDTYDVFENVCTPSCSGKVCGPDGCGGECGVCEIGRCAAGGSSCLYKSGDTCSNPYVVNPSELPASHYVDGSYYPNITHYDGDAVFTFTPSVTQYYEIGTSEGQLLVMTNCLRPYDGAAGWYELATLELSAGTTYYIVLRSGWSSLDTYFTVDAVGGP